MADLAHVDQGIDSEDDDTNEFTGRALVVIGCIVRVICSRRAYSYLTVPICITLPH